MESPASLSGPLPGSQPGGQASKIASDLANYSLPRRRLRQVLSDPSKDPVVLIACGSFSPITFLHLRMFEMAHDYIKFNTNFEVVGSYLSPVSDAYKKAGLASAQDRLNMCEIAVQSSHVLLDVDPWEAIQKEYQPTALVLDHLEHEVNSTLGGVQAANGERKPVQVALLAGADLLETMSTPDVWSDADLKHILSHFPIFILERLGTDLDTAISNLAQWHPTIHCIPQLVHNDISSTKIRLFRRRGMSIRYLVPDDVVTYIEEKGLYRDDGVGAATATTTTTGPGAAVGS